VLQESVSAKDLAESQLEHCQHRLAAAEKRSADLEGTLRLLKLDLGEQREAEAKLQVGCRRGGYLGSGGSSGQAEA
jgi:hypothetical protein